MSKVKVAIVGLGFGKEFIPIYQKYSDSELVAICQRNEEKLNKIGDQFGIENRFTNWDDLLKLDIIDAVHIVTPILDHAKMAIAVLESGKHCASTVPMGTTIDELKNIIRAKKKAKKVYMMMETAVYTREFLYVKELVNNGKIGRIQLNYLHIPAA
ncbi:unnamed protein product, partial [marine sediment metagenome]